MIPTPKMIRVTMWSLVLMIFVSAAVYAAGDEVVPLVDLLDNPIVLFGLGGGAVVTIVLSILKGFRIVGKDGPIPTMVANFVISFVVVTIAGMVDGQTLGTALVSALTALLAAIGYHETVGHAVQKAVVGKG